MYREQNNIVVEKSNTYMAMKLLTLAALYGWRGLIYTCIHVYPITQQTLCEIIRFEHYLFHVCSNADIVTAIFCAGRL